MTASPNPSASGSTMGTRTQRNRPRNQRERSLVPVEKDRFVNSQNATNKATVTRGGQGINRNALGVL